MNTTTIIIWILFAISFSLIIFADKIASIYVRYKIKHNDKPKKETPKEEVKEESIYDTEFDSTKEYDKVIIMDKLRDSMDFITNIGSHTIEIEDNFRKLLKLYSKIEIVTEKHKLNDINRSIIYYFISFNSFKKLYLINKSLDRVTNEFKDESIAKLDENIQHTIGIMDEIYNDLISKQNEIFIRTTDARNKTLKSIQTNKNV